MTAPSEVEAFLARVTADASGFALTLMAALGDRLGLFKALAAGGAITALEFARRAGIDPRYAQEWLHMMVSGGYVSYDPAANAFSLPPAHRPVLAEEGGPHFVGGTHQMLLGMLSVVEALERAFTDGAGIPMSAYDASTWEGMERDMNGVYSAYLVSTWIPALPAVLATLEAGGEVADIGCGSGRCIVLMALAFPKARFTGYDLFTPVIARAAANARTAGVADRVRFKALDAAAGLPEQYDLITTFDVLHDAADPVRLLKAIRQGLKPGGRYMSLEPRASDRLEDNTGPQAALRYGYSLLFCMSTSLAQGGLGLGTMGLTESRMRAFCAEAGFSSVRVAPLAPHDHVLYEVTP